MQSTPTSHQHPPNIGMHLLQWVNLRWHVIITQSPLFTLEFTLGVIYFVGFDKSLMTCIQQYSIIHRSFTALKIMCSAYSSLPSLTRGNYNHWSCYHLHSFGFSTCHRVGLIEYIAFLAWLLSLRNVYLKFLTEEFLRGDESVLTLNRDKERCSASSPIRKMQIQSTRYRCHTHSDQKDK